MSTEEPKAKAKKAAAAGPTDPETGEIILVAPEPAEEVDYGNLTPYEGVEAAGEVESLEVDEIETPAREGMWVRVKVSEAPERLAGSDFVVERATLHRSTGPSTISNDKVEYQLPDDPLLIRSRNTGERFQVTRSQVELPSDERAAFGSR